MGFQIMLSTYRLKSCKSGTEGPNTWLIGIIFNHPRQKHDNFSVANIMFRIIFVCFTSKYLINTTYKHPLIYLPYHSYFGKNEKKISDTRSHTIIAQMSSTFENMIKLD